MKTILTLYQIKIQDPKSYQSCTVDSKGHYSWTTCETFSFDTREQAESVYNSLGVWEKQNASIEETLVDLGED